jgi:hypothetical protein
MGKNGEKKDKVNKESNEDDNHHKHKSSKSKKKELTLPIEFALGARVEVMAHEVNAKFKHSKDRHVITSL